MRDSLSSLVQASKSLDAGPGPADLTHQCDPKVLSIYSQILIVFTSNISARILIMGVGTYECSILQSSA